MYHIASYFEKHAIFVDLQNWIAKWASGIKARTSLNLISYLWKKALITGL